MMPTWQTKMIRKTMRYLLIASIMLFFTSRSSSQNIPENGLSDGHYIFKQLGKRLEKIMLHVGDDTLKILSLDGNHIIIPESGKDEVFLKTSLDVDVMTILFKYRPSTSGFPRQLNTNFNGNIFLGYRVDRYKLKFNKTRPGLKKELHHLGLTVGGFVGIGSTFISQWTTNNQTTDEYDGFILIRGISAMVAFNNLTFGAGLGWDYLTDRDKNIWIYQNKPWLGLTLSLNIN